MKKRILTLICIVLLCLTFAKAGISIGNLNLGNESQIKEDYAPKEEIDGQINISLEGVKYNSYLRILYEGIEKKVSLLDFLDKANANYKCSSSKCSEDYLSSGTGSQSKTFTLNSGQNKLIGFKIQTQDFESIDSFLMNISSNSRDTCNTPLKIDILNDGVIDWVPYYSLNEFCSSPNNGYGCYESSRRESDSNIIWDPYCSKINVSATSSIAIGADIKGTKSNIIFQMEIYDEEGFYDTCNFKANGDKEYYCVVNISSSEQKTYDVCIKTDDEASDYKIGTESNKPCGYTNGDDENLNYDFAIFARPMKYAPIGKFLLSTSELERFQVLNDIEGIIMDYIDDIYDGECENGCFIPINFSSLTNQEISLNKGEIRYSAAVSATENQFYDFMVGESTINMNYSVLELSESGIIVPENFGEYDLSIFIDSTKILDGVSINVLEVPVINFVYPQKAPAGIKTLFRAFVLGESSEGFSWDFGDNSSQETKNNSVVHAYSNIGKFKLKVFAENEFGESEKSFDIVVVSPEEYVEDIINLTRKNIEKSKSLIVKFPLFIKNYLDSRFRFDNLESQIDQLEVKYENSAGSSSEYVEIISSLNSLYIPEKINYSEDNSVKFLPDREAMELSSFQLQQDPTYKDAVFQWFVDSIDAEISSQRFFSTSNFETREEGTYVKIKVNPKHSEGAGKVFFAVNSPLSKIKFADSSYNIKTFSSGVYVEFSELGDEEIEFIIEEGYNSIDVPAYFIPESSKLSVYLEGIDIGICNNNGVCQSELNENSKICRRDCKPWGQILFWLLILLFIGFCIYIFMQEWYKRKYEDYLFKNKNDLYNLINFMDNAEKQTLMREDIFKKLKEKTWSYEEIEYAWKKYKGRRTGLWEIPVFKFIEKINVQKNIGKLRQEGISGKITPIPGARKPEKNILQKQNLNKPAWFSRINNFKIKFGSKKE